MSEWTCVIPGTPRQKGNTKRARVSGGRAFIVPDRRTVEAQETSKSIAWAQRPAALLSSKDDPVALAVELVFAFSIPPSRRRGKRALADGDPHIQRPDLGNLEKMSDDVCEAIAYENDCVIAQRSSRKVWTTGPDETRIVVRRLYGG